MPTGSQIDQLVPPAVRRQAEQAEALEAEMLKAEAGEQPAEPQSVAQSAEPPGTVPQAPQPPAAGEPASSQPLSIEEQMAALQRQLDLERQRNATLQGMIQAEGPTQARIIRDLKLDLENTQRQLSELHKVVTETPPRPVTPKVPGWQRHLKPEEREALQNQEEALGVSGRATLGALEDTLDEIRAEQSRSMKELETAKRQHEEQVAVITENERRAKFYGAVEAIMPGAKALDVTPQFREWLKTPEPGSGKSWMEIGAGAYQIGDVGRVAQIYQAYADQSGITDRRQIEAQVRPETARGARSQAQSQKRRISTREIEEATQTYIRAVKTPAVEKWWAEKEKEFEEAVADNRIDT